VLCCIHAESCADSAKNGSNQADPLKAIAAALRKLSPEDRAKLVAMLNNDDPDEAKGNQQ